MGIARDRIRAGGLSYETISILSRMNERGIKLRIYDKNYSDSAFQLVLSFDILLNHLPIKTNIQGNGPLVDRLPWHQARHLIEELKIHSMVGQFTLRENLAENAKVLIALNEHDYKAGRQHSLIVFTLLALHSHKPEILPAMLQSVSSTDYEAYKSIVQACKESRRGRRLVASLRT